jgi:hypothetical protein
MKKHRNVIVIGDLNAGHEKLANHPTAGLNFPFLQEYLRHAPGTILPSAATWKSYRNTKGPAHRTLDRCISHCTDPHTATAYADWTDPIADHCLLTTKFAFHDIPRDRGRPIHQQKPISQAIDLNWKQTNGGLRRLKIPSRKPESKFRTYWVAKDQVEQDATPPLKFTDENQQPMENVAANEAVRVILKNLWNTPSKDPLPIRDLSYQEDSDIPSKDEIGKAIKSLNKDATTGRDRMPANLVRANPESIDLYYLMFKAVWETGEIPTEWKDMRVRPIAKKNATTTPDGIRPITCLSTSTKIMNKIIASRGHASYQMALHRNQHAYRKHRSRWTAIESLTRYVHTSRKCTAKFLDMSKAFDRVSRAALLQSLHDWNLPKTETNLTMEQYNGAQVYVEYNGVTAEPFTHEIGIRQGCNLSSMLFSLVMTRIHRIADQMFPTGDHLIISYSDDMVILADNEIEANKVLDAVKSALLTEGLLLNEAKTETVEFDLDGPEGTPITWLGCELSRNLSWTAEAKKRLRKAEEGTKLMKNIKRVANITLPAEMMIEITRSLVATHICGGENFITFSQDEKDDFHNILSAAITANTNLGTEKVAEAATALLLRQPFAKNKAKLSSKNEPPPKSGAPIAYSKRNIDRTGTQFTDCRYCALPMHNRGIKSHERSCAQNPNPEKATTKTLECPLCHRMIQGTGMGSHLKKCRSINGLLGNLSEPE